MVDQLDMGEELRLWKPEEVELNNPIDGNDDPEDNIVRVNTIPEEIEVATPEMLQQEMSTWGQLREPEAASKEYGPPPPPRSAAFGDWYSDKYWTHWDWRGDVKKAVARLQKKFPWLTFANTYWCHPPVYGRKFEFVSADFWAGGVVNGRYVGYRGKNINLVINGWKVFNALFNDAHLPNIAWIIHGGKMWTRGYGWGPSPWGPAGSDAGHFYHVHVTYLL